jgi:ribosomal protein S18 acetylase RimI-like enzyme
MDAVRVTALPDRRSVLEAVGQHPYGRFVAGNSSGLHGVAVGEGVFWRCVGPFGPAGYVFGEPAAATGALVTAREQRLLDGLGRLNLAAGVPVPAGWVEREAWDYRWLTGGLTCAARDRADGEAVDVSAVPQPAPDEIDRLLDAAYPDSELRPGHPMVQRWYGVRVDGQLVACAADRSSAADELDAVPTGVIGAVAVHPAHRGRGLGAAVTAEVAAALQARFAQVGLGVTEGNETATRLYEGLGFTGVHRVRSVRPA